MKIVHVLNVLSRLVDFIHFRLSKSEKEYGDLDVKHKELRIGKDREIEGLQKKWEASQDRIAAITREYVLCVCSESCMQRCCHWPPNCMPHACL